MTSIKRTNVWSILICIAIFLFVIPVSCAHAGQITDFASSPNPVGSGARALGMGGAFIAICDDATAASWNPGGLIQVDLAEISVVGSALHRIEKNDFTENPEGKTTEHISTENLNFFSATFPFHIWRPMVVSIIYQHLYDFNRKWDFMLHQQTQNTSVNREVNFEQEGDLHAIGLSYCIKPFKEENFSIGFTLNLWNEWLGSNGWKKRVIENSSGTNYGNLFFRESRSYFKYSFEGINANFGVLWQINNDLKIGAVLKAPFTADVRRESSYYDYSRYENGENEFYPVKSQPCGDDKLDMPMSYGIGVAYRFTEEFTGSVDFYRTEWEDFVYKDADGKEYSPISGLPLSPSDVEATHQIRLGVEWAPVKPDSGYDFSLCGGLFYDPAPSEGKPDDYWGASIGIGILFDRFDFDAAYQYRFGNNVGSALVGDIPFSQDVHEHTIYLSVIYRFGERYNKDINKY